MERAFELVVTKDFPELSQFAGKTLAALQDWFSVALEGRIALAWGERPEFLHWDLVPKDFALLALQRGSDWFQLRGQVSHEAVHALVTPPETYHWAHEMLAECWRIRWLSHCGDPRLQRYADKSVRAALERAGRCSFEDLTNFDSMPYPPFVYDRALLFGYELIASLGWESLKRLPWYFDGNGAPEWTAWIDGMPHRRAHRARQLLDGVI